MSNAAILSIEETQAAARMEEHAEQLTPHAVIQLLLDGALERLDQAALQLRCGREDEAGQLMHKAIGIINGLRESLDFDLGGEMAVRLDRLYGYVIQRLEEAEADTGEFILAESSKMLTELKSGWDAIES
ncbi:flagellar export chaperone FliS [Pseudomaricurvus sp.]|uniref:flagellar export chaperone FliS n=1 Tax=Pseudomaricurvus sp. TaxID=2004510 RepID=UPI003F6CD3EF